MALLQNRPATVHANDCDGPRGMKLKTGLSHRETADTTRRASVPTQPKG